MTKEQTIKDSARRFNLTALTEYLNYAGLCGGIKVTSPRCLISLMHQPKDEQYLQQLKFAFLKLKGIKYKKVKQ